MMNMKRIATVLFSLSLVISCVREDFPGTKQAGQLRLIPALDGLSTKAVTAGEEDRDENEFGTRLDVFFQGAGTGNADFWREYHLSGCSFNDASGELLSDNWMEDGFKPADTYNVYVLVNGPEAAHRYVGSYGALRYLTQTDDEIFKVKQAAGDFTEVGTSGFYTPAKALMMDSAVMNWSPASGESVQTVNMTNASSPLRRAAAKIEVTITFDNTFLSGLIAGGERPGRAMFKYDHFAFSSPCFAAGAPVTPDIRTAPSLMYANGNTVNDGTSTYSYKITTYSYVCSWTAAEAGLTAPSLLVSIPMTGTDGTTYHYYRIPVAKAGTTSLERNHIYKVSATINSKGSWKESEAPIPMNLVYEILDWTESTSTVQATMGDFFEVEPTEKAIWGNGTQTVTLKYIAPKGASLSIVAIPASALTAAGATNPSFATTQTVSGNTYQAFYIDNAGTSKACTINDISIDGGSQTITVTSTALANKAPKYIRFRVSCGSHTQDIYLRHFPTTNIQSIPGWFSYKSDTAQSAQYTFNPDTESPAWTEWDGMEAEATPCPDLATYTGAKDPDKYEQITVTNQRRVQPSSGQYHWKTDPVEVTQDEFQAALADRENRQYANGAANAVQGASGTHAQSYYFGTDPYEFSYSVWGGTDPDGTDYWEKTGPLGYHYFRYTKYYKVTYYTGYARRYYRYAASYSWVRWIPDSETPFIANSKKVSDDMFTVRYYNFAASTMYNIALNSAKTMAVTGEERALNYRNNKMYAIQVSNSDGTMVLGYPIVNESTHQSSDNLVSPAFLVASQLGASTSLRAEGDGALTQEQRSAKAAAHCAQYAETVPSSFTNGAPTDNSYKVYSGWRLPTEAELNLLKDLQNIPGGDAMATIFTRPYYIGLDGVRHTMMAERPSVPADKHDYVRCVRDLTPEEVAELNKIK